MSTRVAINGFGRVGRGAFRAAFERDAEIDWAGINDVADVAMLAHLLKHDSVYGPFPTAVEAGDGFIRVDGIEIPVFNETDPTNLPWDVLDVEVVLEATGRFRSRGDAAKHLEAGARKVIISAPAKEPDATSCSASTSTPTTPNCTTSFRALPPRRTASRPLRRCCTRRSASATA